MSITMQRRIIHTTGVSLSTMLLLVVAQVVVQVTLYFQLTQLLVLFTAIFPLIALIWFSTCVHVRLGFEFHAFAAGASVSMEE